ncbi:MAG TPA: metallophosphoesterase [Thermoleophilia bacterium]|nr:metallophosphoesterase [Thermoleophilia bacterium]
MVFRKAGRSARILFVTDLHASEVTFRKMLNAVEIYEASVLIIGGDLAGKCMVPIIAAHGAFTACVSGEDVVVTEGEMPDLLAKLKNLGQYPLPVETEEYDALASDSQEVERRFADVMHGQVEDWMQRIAARLQPKGIPVYVTGGNDDYLSIEAILDEAPWVVNAESKVIEVAPDVEMISTGFGNPTPWSCPRDILEEELSARINGLAEKLKSPESAIFNLHAPPYGSGLDTAPLLDTSVWPPRPIVGECAPVGSRAVREAIERFQPLLGLHGHIHESRGIQHLGRTTCVNPGSEYTEGLLRSAVIDFKKNGELGGVQLLVA